MSFFSMSTNPGPVQLDNNHYSSDGDYVKSRERMLRVLGDFQLHGIILRRKLGRLASAPKPAQFLLGYQSFIEECKCELPKISPTQLQLAD